MIWKQNQKIRFFSTACPLSNWTILLGYQTKRTQNPKNFGKYCSSKLLDFFANITT